MPASQHSKQPVAIKSRVRAEHVGICGLTLGYSFVAMRLHGDVGVQVVQSAIGLLATLPAALIHALDFLVAASRTLVLLRTWDGHKREHLNT